MRRDDSNINVYILDCNLKVYEGRMSAITWENRIDYVFVKIDGVEKRIAKERWTKRSMRAAFLTMKELEEYKSIFINFCLMREVERVLGLLGR